MLPFAIKRFAYYLFQKVMMKVTGCVFCRIASHQSPAKILYEDDRCIALEDIHPRAPVHVLVIPKKHIASLNDDLDGDEPLLGHLLNVAARTARDKGIDRSGFRTVINTNAEAGQTVFHLHVHVMGGRIMGWPPG
jgi:histidine triad (HIT) family protein